MVGTLPAFIFKMIRSFYGAIGVMFVVAIIWAVDLSLRPYLLKIILNRVAEYPHQEIWVYLATPVTIYFAMTVLMTSTFRVYDYFVVTKMIPRLRQKTANTIFGHLLNQSHHYYQNNFPGSLANKVNDLVNSVPDIIQIAIDRFFSHGLALVFAIYTLWLVDIKFAAIVLIWTTLFISASLIYSKKLTVVADNWSELSSAITGKMVDVLSNILSVRLFARENHEKYVINEVIVETVQAETQFHWANFWMWVIYGYSFVFVQGIALYLLIKGRELGEISVGDFALVLGINIAIVDFLWQLTKEFSQFSKHVGKATQALRTTTLPIEIQDKEHAEKLSVTHGEIVFDKVQFTYQDAKVLFENKSVTIAAGEKVGLVGYSGSGKSTFVNLILRLFDVNQGRILIDGQDIREVTQESLREAIGMIPQDPALFHRSLKENIRYGRVGASDDEIMAAAKKAHADEFIADLKLGYESLVGERGVKLSGGQRQRIAIARAMLKNAPILILDEATSQLDSVTESYIQDSLWHLMQDKTTLVIAHRLSTLLHMDRILVFHEGKIVQDGTHEALLANGGMYKTLWDAQIGGFLLDNEDQTK